MRLLSTAKGSKICSYCNKTGTPLSSPHRLCHCKGFSNLLSWLLGGSGPPMMVTNCQHLLGKKLPSLPSCYALLVGKVSAAHWALLKMEALTGPEHVTLHTQQTFMPWIMKAVPWKLNMATGASLLPGGARPGSAVVSHLWGRGGGGTQLPLSSGLCYMPWNWRR